MPGGMKKSSSSVGRASAAATAAAASGSSNVGAKGGSKAVTGSGSAAQASEATTGSGGNTAAPAGANAARPNSLLSAGITVELPEDVAAAAAAAAVAAAAATAAMGCQHTGFMSLKLKGGGDLPPKKVMLHGELPASLLKFTDKELHLGPVPLHEEQTVLVHLQNTGSTDAAYRVSLVV